MDIKAKIEEAVKKLTSDKNLMAKFERNPVSVIEQLIGIDLPDEQINQLVVGSKAKIKLDQVGDMLGGSGKRFGKYVPGAPVLPDGSFSHPFICSVENPGIDCGKTCGQCGQLMKGLVDNCVDNCE